MYDPQIGGQRYSFAVSGLLWKRNLLLYDRQTESLWSQLLLRAVTGPLAGTPLPLLPSVQTTWARWKRDHPQTRALSFRTGYARDYWRDPYQDFPLARSPALVVTQGGETRIYPFSQLKKAGAALTDEIAGRQIRIEFDARAKTAVARAANGAALPSFVSFLADARAFFPQARVFKGK